MKIIKILLYLKNIQAYTKTFGFIIPIFLIILFLNLNYSTLIYLFLFYCIFILFFFNYIFYKKNREYIISYTLEGIIKDKEFILFKDKLLNFYYSTFIILFIFLFKYYSINFLLEFNIYNVYLLISIFILYLFLISNIFIFNLFNLYLEIKKTIQLLNDINLEFSNIKINNIYNNYNNKDKNKFKLGLLFPNRSFSTSIKINNYYPNETEDQS
jgi:hypothetical protein